MTSLLPLLLSLLFLQLANCALTDAQEKQYQVLHSRVEVLESLVTLRCPTYNKLVRPAADQYADKLAGEYGFYNLLSSRLQQCQLTRKVFPPPTECENATTLRDAWRTDYEGQNIKPGGEASILGRACDVRKDLQWFRFAGAAGNRMLNRPPKPYSCGTYWPYWTDAEMPTKVGVVKTVEAHGVQGNFPRAYSAQIEVMRCSTDTENDLIYRHPGPYTDLCQSAFCGME